MGEDSYLASYYEDQIEVSGPWDDERGHGPDDNYADGEPGEDLDGDHTSALASAGWGTEEDYGYFGEREDFGWFGEIGCNEE